MQSGQGLEYVLCWNMVVLRHDFFADEAIKSVTIAVTSSVEMGAAERVCTADSTKYHVVSCEFINGKIPEGGEIRAYPLSWRLRRLLFRKHQFLQRAYTGGRYVSSKKSDAKRSLTITAKLKGVKGLWTRWRRALGRNALGKSQVV